VGLRPEVLAFQMLACQATLDEQSFLDWAEQRLEAQAVDISHPKIQGNGPTISVSPPVECIQSNVIFLDASGVHPKLV